MRLYIIAGTADGIGASLAEQLLSPGSVVHCVSEKDNPSLIKFARMRQLALFYDILSWSEEGAHEKWLDKILSKTDPQEWEQICFIYSAATLGPIRKLGRVAGDAEALQRSLDINLLIPYRLTNLFIQYTQSWTLEKQMLFMGSSTAIHAIPKLSSYSMSKSAIETLVENLRLEQAEEPYPIKASCLYPQIMDMQLLKDAEGLSETLRELKNNFHSRQGESNLSAQYVACEIVKVLQDEEFGSQNVIEVAAI